MALLMKKSKLRCLSDDDFVSDLYSISDRYGFLHPKQMLKFGVYVTVALTVSDFLEILSFALLQMTDSFYTRDTIDFAADRENDILDILSEDDEELDYPEYDDIPTHF